MNDNIPSDMCVNCHNYFYEYNLIRCPQVSYSHPYCYNCFKDMIDHNQLYCIEWRLKFPQECIDKVLEQYIPKKKRYFGHSQGSNIRSFDINDIVIKCCHCKEHFEYDTLISYFTVKYRENKEYIPDCIHCHTKFSNEFMYDMFGIDFCKKVLNLFDPYACKYCQERKNYIHCNVCADCMIQHFQSSGNTVLDCKECHKVFTSKFMYDTFEYDYCKNVLKIEDPYACKYCHVRFYRTYKCDYCYTDICLQCEKHHLEEQVKNRKCITCMNCNHIYDEFVGRCLPKRI